jgi:hypothetical protein
VTVTAASASDRETLAFVQKTCMECHNAKDMQGGISLAGVQHSKTFTEDRVLWQKVYDMLDAGMMPPLEAKVQPPAAEIDSIRNWIKAEFDRQDASAKPFAGSVSSRRLNRVEYDNTIRDLLGVDLRASENFPPDSAAFGFDNISDALKVSPVLLERYLDAAQTVVRAAIFGPEKLKPAFTHFSAPYREHVRPTDLMKPYDLTGLSSPSSTHTVHRFPVTGTYSFKFITNGHRPNQSEPARVALWIDGKLIQEQPLDATDLEGQFVEYKAKVEAGEHIISATYLSQYHGLPPSYKGPEPSKRDPAPLVNTRGALTEKDREIFRKLGTSIKTDRVETRTDNRFESIDIGGPFEQTTGPSAASLRKVFVCGHAAGKHTDACARTIVTSFAGKAFRRPATQAEVAKYLPLVALAKKQGDSFEEGIATALEAILVAPQFLFRVERVPIAKADSVPVTDYELASRLSYFLWSSTPDETLLRLAAAKTLSQPAVLNAQVKRMLLDPKSKALVSNFGGQWLQLRNIEVSTPDVEKFPDWDEYLRRSMRTEMEMFFENVIRADRPISDFLDANYTFVNDRLARFYGIDGVTGSNFRQVDVTNTKRGGGLLAQAGILTISSYATRTSPVLRGKWVLENLLNAPPPPPPPSVPALEETKVGQGASLREQMETHRKNTVCASCHARMDPIGFGLENFNGIGAWREMDGKSPVNAAGTLVGGRSFNGPKEFKALLAKDPEPFSKAITEKLFTYAMGRGIENYDTPVLKSIHASMTKQNYRFSALVLGIVNSVPFRMRSATNTPLVASNKEPVQ